MPTSESPPCDVLAHRSGMGALLNDADGWLSFAPHRGHPGRLAHADEVVERISELRPAQTPARDTPSDAADHGEIAKEFSGFAEVQIRVAGLVDA